MDMELIMKYTVQRTILRSRLRLDMYLTKSRWHKLQCRILLWVI